VTALAQFQFPATGQAVRTVEVDGEAYFVAADVTTILGYTNGRAAVSQHVDEEDRNTVVIRDGMRGNPNVAIVNESGLYALIFGSRLEAAKVFKRWVTAEVLPTLRRTGSYAVASRVPDLTTPEGVLALAERFTETARDLVESEKARREMEPKAVAYDAFLSADAGDRLVRQVAKELGLKEMDLRRFLVDQKLIFVREAACGAKQYEPYATHAHHFKPVEKVVEHTWGTCSHFTLYIRPSGVDLAHRRLVAENTRYQAALIAATDSEGK